MLFFISCCCCSLFFFFNDTATTEIYTLSLHDALPIFTATVAAPPRKVVRPPPAPPPPPAKPNCNPPYVTDAQGRSEEHTSELQSLAYLVCRLLLEKKKKKNNIYIANIYLPPTPLLLVY